MVEEEYIIICNNCGKEFKVEEKPDYNGLLKCPHCGHENTSLIQIDKIGPTLKYWAYI